VLSFNDVHSQQQPGWAAPEQFAQLGRLPALRSLTWITPGSGLCAPQLRQLAALPALRELVLAPGSNTGVEDLRALSALSGLHKLEVRLGLQHERHRRLLASADWQPLLSSLDAGLPGSLVTFTRDPTDLTT
jgi:hypothetical protein